MSLIIDHHFEMFFRCHQRPLANLISEGIKDCVSSIPKTLDQRLFPTSGGHLRSPQLQLGIDF